jgi:hypothetical protein
MNSNSAVPSIAITPNFCKINSTEFTGEAEFVPMLKNKYRGVSTSKF